ncbi:hypothetical protein Pla110_32900 [Polystyrenella longa]|uniref:Uncharacterized protein n=1 Tax=Polystyrenella longa TaxID=2528007 RepID=A0A518CQP5_9PLAN|nr:hypothetical protein [Polystyrenella longa]QDU81548.1 hypothetical protein Pla110_32900 [Polystyrenella longa]
MKKKDTDPATLEQLIKIQADTLNVILSTIRERHEMVEQSVADLIDEGKLEQVMRIVEKSTSTLEKFHKMHQPVGRDEIAVITYEQSPVQFHKAKRIEEKENDGNETENKETQTD